jgi:hypothetical protein
MAGCNFCPFGVQKKSESESESEHSHLFFLAPALTLVMFSSVSRLQFFNY